MPGTEKDYNDCMKAANRQPTAIEACYNILGVPPKKQTDEEARNEEARKEAARKEEARKRELVLVNTEPWAARGGGKRRRKSRRKTKSKRVRKTKRRRY